MTVASPQTSGPSSGVNLADLSPEVRAALAPRWAGFLNKAVIALVLAVLLGVSYYPAEVDRWTFLITDADNMAVFISDFLKPDFTDLGFFVLKMIETVQFALWGTVLSIIVGVPCGLLSSNNIAPVWVVQPMRRRGPRATRSTSPSPTTTARRRSRTRTRSTPSPP